jgi:hypothetical protein
MTSPVRCGWLDLALFKSCNSPAIEGLIFCRASAILLELLAQILYALQDHHKVLDRLEYDNSIIFSGTTRRQKP